MDYTVQGADCSLGDRMFAWALYEIYTEQFIDFVDLMVLINTVVIWIPTDNFWLGGICKIIDNAFILIQIYFTVTFRSLVEIQILIHEMPLYRDSMRARIS